MERQKRVAVIHDLAGYGRCALAVALPVISAMRVECCVLPTAILSSNAAFPGYFMQDYTEQLEMMMERWEGLDLTFDGIYCGFLSSPEQAGLVERFIKRFRGPNTIVLFDPVMGDHGRLYSAVSDEVCLGMRRLVSGADILTPNLTEAYRLTNREYRNDVPADEELWELAAELCAMGPAGVVITGIPRENQLMNFVCEKGREPVTICTGRIGGDRCGTGDVFASIVCGSAVRGMDLPAAVKKAAEFIADAAAYTDRLGISPRNGLCFEEFLHTLG